MQQQQQNLGYGLATDWLRTMSWTILKYFFLHDDQQISFSLKEE